MRFLNCSNNEKNLQTNLINCYCVRNIREWVSGKYTPICFDKRSSLQYINKNFLNFMHEKHKCFKKKSVKYKKDFGIEKYGEIFKYLRNYTFHFVDSNLYMNFAIELGINSKPKTDYDVAIVDFNEKSVQWMQKNLTVQSLCNLKNLLNLNY